MKGTEESVHEYIRQRCVRLGQQLIETNKTVREIAKETGYSKSTVHKDLTERLEKVNKHLANEVNQILAYHKSIRHIRGGQATKNKWKSKNNQSE